MKLELTITGDTQEDLSEALQKAIDRVGQGMKGGDSTGGGTDSWHYAVKMKGILKQVLVGEFIEYGMFVKDGDEYELAIVNGEYEIKEVYEEDIESTLDGRDWIVLDEYQGEIVMPMRGIR